MKGEEHSSQPSLIPILVLYTVACLFCSYPPKASRLSESPKLPPSSASPHLPYLRCLRLLFPPLPSSSLPSPLSPLSPLPSLPSPLSPLGPLLTYSCPFTSFFDRFFYSHTEARSLRPRFAATAAVQRATMSQDRRPIQQQRMIHPVFEGNGPARRVKIQVRC